MDHTCRTCGQSFTLLNEELSLYRKFGHAPIPECFACIQKHHLSFRNGRVLYRRTCDATGKSIISNIAPNAPFPVYEREYWMSDAWDSLSYGRDYDSSQSFFDQFRGLQRVVPRMALLNINPVNSEYCNMCSGNKNCYLVFGGDENQDTYYGTLCMRNRDCVDCDYSNENELSSLLMNSFSCYGCRVLYDSKHCRDCAYCSDCIGCSDCILCTGLSQKRYCIENRELTEEEYRRQQPSLVNGSFLQHSANVSRLMRLRSARTVKHAHLLNCEECTGDFIENSKNCQNCFFAWGCRDLTNAVIMDHATDCFQATLIGGKGSELCYHMVSAIPAKNSKFSYFLIECSDMLYCESCLHSQHCFGCNGLRHKEYCVLNKQYTKEEYESLVPRIIEQMKVDGEYGEFFPKDLSCFAYNESTAAEYWPMTKEQALAQGYRWRDALGDEPKSERVIDASELPDTITKTPDDILSWGIRCMESGRLFKIVKQELAFYRTWNLPIPRLHPDVRYRKRMESVNPFLLHKRTCAKCGITIETTYEPSRPEVVYCEECYLQTVY